MISKREEQRACTANSVGDDTGGGGRPGTPEWSDALSDMTDGEDGIEALEDSSGVGG